MVILALACSFYYPTLSSGWTMLLGDWALLNLPCQHRPNQIECPLATPAENSQLVGFISCCSPHLAIHLKDKHPLVLVCLLDLNGGKGKWVWGDDELSCIYILL